MPETLNVCPLCSARSFEVIDPECSICRCGSCGYVFDNPRPTREEITAYYSRPVQYDDWLAQEGERDLLWRRRLVKVRCHMKPGALLDVGAGTGQFLALAREHFASVTGTEVSESAVAIAREKYGLELVRAQVEETDFLGERFDTITLFHVLEHVHDPRRVVEKCRTLLNPGGVLMIAVPNDLRSLRNRTRKLLNRLGVKRIRYPGVLGLPRLVLDGSLAEIHLSHFTPEVLQRLLEGEGFAVVESGLDPYYTGRGMRLFVNTAQYLALSAVRAFAGINLYETIWMVARKQ